MTWYTGVVADNADPDQLGRLRLKIGALLPGDTVYPGWLEPALVAPSHDGAVGSWWVPPVDAVVLVERHATGTLRWRGGLTGGAHKLPTELSKDYPERAGFTDPSGKVIVALSSSAAIVKAQEVLLGAEDASHGVPLGDKLLDKIAQVLGEVAAIGKAITPSPVPTPNTDAWLVELTAGTPAYLSSTVKVKP